MKARRMYEDYSAHMSCHGSRINECSSHVKRFAANRIVVLDKCPVQALLMTCFIIYICSFNILIKGSIPIPNYSSLIPSSSQTSAPKTDIT